MATIPAGYEGSPPPQMTDEEIRLTAQRAREAKVAGPVAPNDDSIAGLGAKVRAQLSGPSIGPPMAPVSDAPPMPEIKEEMGLYRDQTEGTMGGNMGKDVFAGVGGGGAVESAPDPNTVSKMLVDYATAGGKTAFKKRYEEAPKELSALADELEATRGKRYDEVAAVQAGESKRMISQQAATVANNAEHQAQVQARQQELESATKSYTADLHNQGKFWENPGNIVSAIAFSLMPIFSNDPTIGAKLINQAIDRDMDARRTEANSALGGMRSNLAGYEKIYGDKRIGDLAAQAEAQAVAAQEIQRIGAKYTSKESQQKTGILAKQFAMEAEAKSAEVKASLIIKPQVINKQILAAYGTDEEMGLSTVDGSRGLTVGPGGRYEPAVAGAKGVSSGASGGGGGGGTLTTPQKAILKASGDDYSRRALEANERSPGSVGRIMQLRKSAIGQAISYGARTPKEIGAYLNAEVKAAEDSMLPASTAYVEVSKSLPAFTDFSRQAKNIIALEKVAGNDPNEVLGNMRSILGQSAMHQYDKVMEGIFSSGESPEAQAKKARAVVIQSFRQKLGNQMASYRHATSGANVGKTELPTLEEVMDTTRDLQNALDYSDTRGRELAGQADNAFNSIKNPLGRELFMLYRGVGRDGMFTPNMRGVAGRAK